MTKPKTATPSKHEHRRISQIHEFWESKAKEHKADHWASWGDRNMINLEIRAIREYVTNGDHVLDAGCSNGYSTFRIAEGNNVRVRAFDYSKASIRFAHQKQAELGNRGIEFYYGNILDIAEPSSSFDTVYTIRVVINLPSFKLQQQAITEVHRVLKPGGLYLMSEAFSGSLAKLNALRKLANLPPLKSPEFNLYLNERALEKFVHRRFKIVAVRQFSSVYYVASRFLRYLTMKPGDKDSYDNEINNFFARFRETENSGDFGIQKLYVLKKRKG